MKGIKKHHSRFLAMLMIFVMIFTMIPATAFASTETLQVTDVPQTVAEETVTGPTISEQPQDLEITLPWGKSQPYMRVDVKKLDKKDKVEYTWYKNDTKNYEGAEKIEGETSRYLYFSNKTTKECEEYYYSEITYKPADGSEPTVLKSDIAKFTIKAPEDKAYGVIVGEEPIGKVYVSVVDTVAKKDNLKDSMGNVIEDIGPMKTAPVNAYEETLYPSDNMMTVIARAILVNGGSQKGADKGYIESITNAKGETRAEFSRGNGSGWMGTLNGWKTNMGFQNYSVENGELQAGDIIKVMYTTDLGADIGLDDKDAELALTKLQVYGYYDRWADGEPETSGNLRLAEEFNSDKYEYTALVNRNKIWVYTEAKNSSTRVKVYYNGKEYSGSNTIANVENGDQVKVVLTNPSDPSGKKVEYVLNIVKEQTILHDKEEEAFDVEYFTKDGTSLGKDDKLAYVSHSGYYEYSSSAPGYSFDEKSNANAFTITLKDLPEGFKAKLETKKGNKSYDFVDNKVTVKDHIDEAGTYEYYIKLQNGNIRESYLLIITKKEASFGVEKAQFIGGNVEFSSDNVYNGEPEGTYFQVGADGKETGKTGYHAGAYNYNIYVNNRVTSVKTLSSGFIPVGYVGYKDYWRVTISSGESDTPLYTDELNSSWFSQKVRYAINDLNEKTGFALDGEKTKLSINITKVDNEEESITYNFNFIRVKTTPADVEKLIEKLPAVGVVSYGDDKTEIESVEAAFNELSEDEQSQVSKEARDKLKALRKELNAQKETGEKLIEKVLKAVEAYKEDVPASKDELTKTLFDKYADDIDKSEEAYNQLKDWALEQFQTKNKDEYKVLANAVKILNLYRIKANTTIGTATDYIDDFMTPSLAYNINLGQPEDAYRITFSDIIYSDVNNRPEERRGEAGIPYNIPGRLKVTVADESILEIKTVKGEYVDKGLGGGGVAYEDEQYYMVPKKAGTTTITATLTDETGVFYGQIPEITVHVNNEGEAKIEDLASKLTNISSLAYTRSNDTWYYWQGQAGASFKFKVNGEDAKVTVKEYLGSKKTEYTPDKEGNVTVLLKDGYNSIEVSAKYDGKKVTQAYGIKAKVIDYEITNKSRPGYELRQGDTASIKITGISVPVYKILRIYNPTAPMITYYTEDLPQQYEIKGGGGMMSTSEIVMYPLEVELTGSGKIKLKGGHLTTSWYGSSVGSEGSQGNTGGIADQHPGAFSVLPDLTLDVAENKDYKSEVAYVPEVVGGNTVKAGQKVTIKLPTLPTAELEKKYPAVTYAYDDNKFINAQTKFATNIPNVTVESDFITNPNNGMAVSLDGLKTLTFTVPANTPAGQYSIYGGKVALKQGDYVYTISKTVDLYKGQIGDIVINVEEADTDNIYETTGKWITENVSNPIVSSIGGEWAVLGLARAGYPVPEDYFSKYVDNVVKELKAKNGVLDERKYTEYSRVILALTAIGEDVTDIGGYNLLENLSDYTNICKQGINGPIWALIALDSHDYEIPTVAEGGTQATRENLIQTILDKKLSTGGWTLVGEKADTDMTAMAIQALAPYYDSNEAVKAAIDKAVNLLSEMQNEDGSFSSSGAGSGPNAESTAQVIVALTALGIDPHTDGRFVKTNGSALDALCTFYVEGGGFKHIASGNRDGMATEQGYYALAAYYRYASQKTSLYDMSDVKIGETHYHVYGEEWKCDGTHHWNECECGEVGNKAAHDFKWVVDKKATADSEGSKHQECKVCGYKSDSVNIPALGSDAEAGTPGTPDSPATDAEAGTSNSPTTGDENMMLLWVVLAGLSLSGVITVATRRKNSANK